MGPMIRAASLRGFAPLVRELGGDPDALCRRFEIDAAALVTDDALVSITAHDLMLDAAAGELDCPDLGLRLAMSQDITILGPVAVAIAHASTVAQALACAGQFMFVHSPALSIGVEADPRGARGVIALTYRKDLRESTYSAQGIELGMALFLRVARSLIGHSFGLRSVELPHAPLSPLARYTEAFGTQVGFGGSVAAIRVQSTALEEQFAGANEGVHARAVAHLAGQSDPRALTSAQLRLALAELLGGGTPTLAQAASLLGLQPRTLQRRLTGEGSTFEGVLDSVRREAAHRYLTTTDLPMTQIAALVGFGEQSALSRAVRRWFGESPRDVRRRAAPGRVGGMQGR